VGRREVEVEVEIEVGKKTDDLTESEKHTKIKQQTRRDQFNKNVLFGKNKI